MPVIVASYHGRKVRAGKGRKGGAGFYFYGMSKPLRIGVLGAGHLGKVHMGCLRQLPDVFEWVGFFDPEAAAREAAAREAAAAGFGVRAFDSVEALVEAVEVVDIVTPTPDHSASAGLALRAGRHVFIEKPVTRTVEEAQALGRWAAESGALVQVGHVERFNPAWVAARPHITRPIHWEAQRLSPYQLRGTDVSVVLDLMIHDIDALLHVVQAPVVAVEAKGYNLWSAATDWAWAGIRFADGTTAHLTASRLSSNRLRESQILQSDRFITVDYLEKQATVTERSPAGATLPVHTEELHVTPANAILEELRSFGDHIRRGVPPVVGLEDGIRALGLACQIQEEIDRHAARVG